MVVHDFNLSTQEVGEGAQRPRRAGRLGRVGQRERQRGQRERGRGGARGNRETGQRDMGGEEQKQRHREVEWQRRR